MAKRSITIEIEEDVLREYSKYRNESISVYSQGLQEVIRAAKKLYPQYEEGQWYKVTFSSPDRPCSARVLRRIRGGWTITQEDRYPIFLDGAHTISAVKMVEAEG